jgi:hypothetical protein
MVDAVGLLGHRELPIEAGPSSASFGLAELVADFGIDTKCKRCEERGWMLPHVQAVIAALPRNKVCRLAEAASIPGGANQPFG